MRALGIPKAIALGSVGTCLVTCYAQQQSSAASARKITAEYEKRIAIACECLVQYATADYPTYERCDAELGQERSLWACEEAVIATFPETARIVACLLEAEKALTACLNSQPCSALLREKHNCFALHEKSAKACEPIPYDLWLAVGYNCYQMPIEEPFTCLDGYQIPESWHCDGEGDCRDASDEIDCS